MSHTSFLPTDADHPFPIQNLPYGVFSTQQDARQRPGVAIGDFILDLEALSRSAHFADAPVSAETFQKGSLDAFIACDPEQWSAFRKFLQSVLSSSSKLAGSKSDQQALLVSRTASTTKLHLPLTIGDYTDFYASYEHAFNCGSLIRGPENAMQPNWHHLPVAYHGRASSVVVSGTPFHRPCGQVLDKPGDKQPIVAPCRKLDYELEMAFIYGGKPTRLGQRLSPAQARKRIFGMMLMNDWSARDIQTWEYVPLGPFLSKNFCTTVAPWIVSPEAVAPLAVEQYRHEPALLPYLEDKRGCTYDVPLTIDIKGAHASEYARVARSSLRHTYYTMAQMLAHHSTTGCLLRPSDMLATGTLSAPHADGLGSLLERSKLGKEPFALDAGRADMTFLRDGDSVRMSGTAHVPASGGAPAYSIGFGECEGTVLPALPFDDDDDEQDDDAERGG